VSPTPGCAGLAPNGLFNFGRSETGSEGVALQWTHLTESHQIVLGSTFDWNDVDFRQSQMLGFIDSERSVYLDPSREADLGLLPLSQEITRNNLTGSSSTAAFFFSDTWTAAPNLFVTYGARLSYSRVKNELQSDKPIPLYQFTSNFFNTRAEVCGTLSSVSTRFLCSTGDYGYRSLNPSLGVSWLPAEDLNVYGNVSRGSRVPSVIELGCARDKTLEDPNGLNDGKNIGCTIPTALTSDPFLPQVRSLTTELGLRGTGLAGQLSWSATAYRTELTDDILFVSLGQRNRGVFDTFGKTERDGFELNLKGKFGRHSLRAGYSRLNATFESSARIVNTSNSSSDRTPGRLDEFTINPGDVIPGLPKHSFRLGWNMEVTSDFSFGLSMIAQSFVFARGNENNESEPGGTDLTGDAQIPGLGKRYVGKGKTSGFAVFNLNRELPRRSEYFRFLQGRQYFRSSIYHRWRSRGQSLHLGRFRREGFFRVQLQLVRLDAFAFRRTRCTARCLVRTQLRIRVMSAGSCFLDQTVIETRRGAEMFMRPPNHCFTLNHFIWEIAS
jgi:iron complex outermembrane receptor protein